jgi:hypothetical protein
MKDFSNASFSPGVIDVMNEAMETAVAMPASCALRSLPQPFGPRPLPDA